MANRIDNNRTSGVEKPNRHDAGKNYFSETGPFRSSYTRKQYPFDDLIVSLANAHENRRARQVTEWEQMRQPYLAREFN
ncbi:MAG: hypothetical protein ABR530_03890 [Pyrinomonadaceae bacterium]